MRVLVEHIWVIVVVLACSLSWSVAVEIFFSFSPFLASEDMNERNPNIKPEAEHQNIP
jgi:hypothetical protein